MRRPKSTSGSRSQPCLRRHSCSLSFFFLGFDSIAGGQLSPWLNPRIVCGSTTFLLPAPLPLKEGARRPPPAAPFSSAKRQCSVGPGGQVLSRRESRLGNAAQSHPCRESPLGQVARKPEGKPRECPRSQAPGISSCKDWSSRRARWGPRSLFALLLYLWRLPRQVPLWPVKLSVPREAELCCQGLGQGAHAPVPLTARAIQHRRLTLSFGQMEVRQGEALAASAYVFCHL